MLAIPGMNPGIFVMGGGGDGGGSGAGGGKGKNGKQGANGKNGGKDANGGGKGAGACGAGTGGSCPNPSHGGGGGTAAGDPVDPVTGRVYTIAQTDLVLTGPLVFELKRSCSTFAIERDVGLGFGWTHSLAWELEVRRRTMTVHLPTGTSVVRTLPDVGGEVTLDGGARMRRDSDRFTIADTSGLIYFLEPVFATVSGGGITGRGASASARNGDPPLHPIVQQALPGQNNGQFPAGTRPPLDLRRARRHVELHSPMGGREQRRPPARRQQPARPQQDPGVPRQHQQHRGPARRRRGPRPLPQLLPDAR